MSNREFVIRLRVTPEELAQVKSRMEQAGMKNLSGYDRFQRDFATCEYQQ